MKEYAGPGGRSKRAKRRTYVDGMLSSDEETENIEDGLDPEELYQQKVYPAYFVQEMKGEDVTVEHFQKTGFPNLFSRLSSQNESRMQSQILLTSLSWH